MLLKKYLNTKYTEKIEMYLSHLKDCCKYSLWAYNSPSKFTSSKVVNIRKNALYIKDANSTFIAFRGTSCLEDTTNAFVVLPVKTAWGHVHRGFYSRYATLETDITNILKDDDSEYIYFVGHSMGGAIALLASVHAKEYLKDKKIYCCMFGTPTTCDTNFLKHADGVLDDLVSIEIRSDIVPNIPLNPIFRKPSKVLVLNGEDFQNTLNIRKNHSCKSYYKLLSKMSQ